MEGRPNRLEPKVLKMRKKQVREEIVYAKVRRRSVRKDGSPVMMDFFEEGIPVQLKVILQVCESRAIHSCCYEWDAGFEVLQGGWQVVGKSRAVMAPVDGYARGAFRIEMTEGMEGNWIRSSPNGAREFWLSLQGGGFARLRVEFVTGRDHWVDIDLWYNGEGGRSFEGYEAVKQKVRKGR
ncbi:hypothetical protein [Rubritalea tangerina]|uniref:hypothetical protein n=1 Tax=Rubritalea tangerina TaxID=430798 RepID=UPI0036124F7A